MPIEKNKILRSNKGKSNAANDAGQSIVTMGLGINDLRNIWYNKRFK